MYLLLLNIVLLVVMFIAAIIAPRAVDITNHIMTVVSVQRKLSMGYIFLIFLIFRQAIVGLRCGGFALSRIVLSVRRS